MKDRMLLRLLFLFILIPVLPMLTHGQEQSLKKKNVPKPVLKAFNEAYPKATIKGFSKEIEKGVTEYEIESVEGKIHRDVSYKADGTVIVVEESVAFKDLPEPVRNSVTRNYPKAEVRSCEKVTEGVVVSYELGVKSGGKKLELEYNADGSLKKREKK